MGYDIHITRKQNWFDDEGDPIPLDEWLAHIRSDPEMRHDKFAETFTPDGTPIRTHSPGFGVWVGYSRHVEGKNMVWFRWFEGMIVVKNPDPEILCKMHRIASLLGARVQGDEGEFYGPDGEMM